MFGKVSVEVNVVGVIPTEAVVVASSLLRDLVPVRVEGGEEEDLGVVEEVGDPGVPAVVECEVLGQVYEELATDDLVAVHVAGIFEHRLQVTPPANISAELDVDQRTSGD